MVAVAPVEVAVVDALSGVVGAQRCRLVDTLADNPSETLVVVFVD